MARYKIVDNKVCYQKLEYMHDNPLHKGFVEKPECWLYSSARNYILGARGITWWARHAGYKSPASIGYLLNKGFDAVSEMRIHVRQLPITSNDDEPN